VADWEQVLDALVRERGAAMITYQENCCAELNIGTWDPVTWTSSERNDRYA